MKNKSALTLIFLTVFIDLLGFGILIPILPAFAKKELGVDETAIGIAIAIYSFVQFLFNPFFGKLSDKYGRRPVIIFTLLINAFGYVIFAFTNSFLMLLISRIVAGIGGSSIGVAQAYIADITSKEERSRGMGLIGSAFGLGFMFGPLLGGVLSEYGYMITGLGAAGFSFIAFLLTIFFLPESHVNRDVTEDKKRKLIDIKGMKVILSKPELAFLIGIFFILTFSIANIYGTFALLGLHVYGFSDLQNGYLYGIMGFFSALVQGGLIGYINKLLSRKKILIIGSFLTMISLALLPFGQTFLGITLILVVMVFGTSTFQPTLLSLISEVATDSEQGVTLSINQSFSALARVLGPLWGGFAFEFLGYPFPFLTGAVFTFFMFLLLVFYLPKIMKLD